MKYTKNYNLKKPEATDSYNVDDFNENADVIDTELAAAMKFKRLLTSEDDMNNIKEDGIYAYSTDAVTQGLKNAPFANAAVVLVFGSTSTSSQKIQLAFRYGAAGQGKFRALYDNKWQEWAEFAVATDGIVAVANGGTGASTAAAARANLGAAPAGYGLGTACKSISKVTDITENGWWLTNGDTPDGNYWMCLAFTANTSRTVAIHAYSVTGNLHATRSKVNGVWQPWEWVNPPMLLNVEYRTTERYNDKPVYYQLVEVGAFPYETEMVVEFEQLANINQVIEWHATNTNSGTNIEQAATVKSITVMKNTIVIITTGDGRSWNVRFLLKYTKTTD